MVQINIGCGQTPTKGWLNYDNSFSLRLSKFPALVNILARIGLINQSQNAFIQFSRIHSIEYGDATKGLPLDDNSVDVLYSSHMLEHLDRHEASKFLNEAIRVLCSGGIIRLVLPDLQKMAQKYIETGDADAFVSSTHLTQPRPRTLAQRIRILLVGTRHHQWMYDGASLTRLLEEHGFKEPTVLQPGETSIENVLNLDLCERKDVSVYVEAKKP